MSMMTKVEREMKALDERVDRLSVQYAGYANRLMSALERATSFGWLSYFKDGYVNIQGDESALDDSVAVMLYPAPMLQPQVLRKELGGEPLSQYLNERRTALSVWEGNIWCLESLEKMLEQFQERVDEEQRLAELKAGALQKLTQEERTALGLK